MRTVRAVEMKDILLVGGGHSQIEVLKRFGMAPDPGVRLTLLTSDFHAPYSGMLPGYIAGHYSFDEVHIDLRPLAHYAGARIIHDQATGIDLENKQVICATRPPISFDFLSINIGSRPETLGVPGASEYALPIRPVDAFRRGWDSIVERVKTSKKRFRILVVGGGAGGVELLLSIHHYLTANMPQDGHAAGRLEFHLAMDTKQILTTHNRGVRRRMERALRKRDIHVHREHRIIEVKQHEVLCDNRGPIPFDALIWVTQASAPSWIAASGLATDEAGFIAVDDALQSTSHPFVFAAGDISTIVSNPRPKSGVYAVRQGPFLADNLRNVANGMPVKPYIPQRRFLSLISTGDKNAVASKGLFVMEGRRIWKWKDRIDRRFMEKYSPEMLMSGMEKDTNGAMDMRCGGCGCKVGSATLDAVLKRIQNESDGTVLVGLDEPDDAAVIEVPEGKLSLHTVDFFRSFVDDGFLFGQITAVHAMSDIYAMGGTPHNVLSMVTLPFELNGRQREELLFDLLSGTLKILREESVVLVGGHTTEGPELTYGLTVNGFASRDELKKKSGMEPGDVLILTKALGTGVLFAGDMRGEAKGRWIESALPSMVQSNWLGAECLFEYGTRACTDVTGFGLAGHLLEMLNASKCGAILRLSVLPLLTGVRELIAKGVLSTLHPENSRTSSAIADAEHWSEDPLYPALFDPQTAGGLLGSIPKDRADACVAALHKAGYKHATIIGEVLPQPTDAHTIRLQA